MHSYHQMITKRSEAEVLAQFPQILEGANDGDIQKAYNQEHGITPTSVKKKIDEGLRAIIPQKETDKKKIIDIKKVPKDEYSRLIKELSAQMDMASANLEFEKAAELRDLIADIRSQL